MKNPHYTTLLREYRVTQPGRDTVEGIAFWYGMECANLSVKDASLIAGIPGSKQRGAWLVGKHLAKLLACRMLRGPHPFVGPWQVRKAGERTFSIRRTIFDGKDYSFQCLCNPAGKARLFRFAYSAEAALYRLVHS